jgi:hypothetical protein
MQDATKMLAAILQISWTGHEADGLLLDALVGMRVPVEAAVFSCQVYTRTHASVLFSCSIQFR